MEGSQQAAQGSPSPQSVKFHIVDLPDGIINFTAPPKSHTRGKRGSPRCRTSTSPAQRPRRIVSPKEISDISGMMTKLDVGTPANADSDGTGTTTQRCGLALARRIATARRQLATKSTENRRKMSGPSTSGGTDTKFFGGCFGGPATRSMTSTTFTTTQTTASGFAFSGCGTSDSPFFTFSAPNTHTKVRPKQETHKKWVGSWRIPFEPPVMQDEERKMEDGIWKTIRKQCKYQNISAMEVHRNKSPEELRAEDYLSGRKGPVSITHYGSKFQAPTGGDIVLRRGHSYTISTKHQCITAMLEYKDKSQEELRIEHYMPSLGWRDRERYSLAQKELQHLPISLDSVAYVFLDSRKKGKVKYIGRLPDKRPTEIHVGIEYDGPTGMGNGKYKDIRLFRTKEGRAEIVPLDSVLPEYLVEDEMATPEESRKSDSEGAASSMAASEPHEGAKCSVCWTNQVEMFFIPCGHVCCCTRCAKSMTDCPICRKKIKQKYRAYLS